MTSQLAHGRDWVGKLVRFNHLSAKDPERLFLVTGVHDGDKGEFVRVVPASDVGAKPTISWVGSIVEWREKS